MPHRIDSLAHLSTPAGDVRLATTHEPSRGPSREDYHRLTEHVARLTEQMAAANRELEIQFKRIAELQAEIDVMRGAWAKLGSQAAV